MQLNPAAEQPGLLQLPDPCLLAVLRCCLGDQRSVCSAARAHSRLHSAAVEALSSITAVLDQNQLDTLVDVYLSKHGQHVDSISLKGVGGACILRQLPSALTKLSSVEFRTLDLQLQPGGSYQSVLGAAAPSLRQLQLEGCKLAEEGQGLTAALSLPPDLEHLSITCMPEVVIPDEVWLKLCQLTHLELEGAQARSPDPGQPTGIDLQHLSVLTQLADLRLSMLWDWHIMSVGTLPGLQRLTRLQLTNSDNDLFEPAALAGKTLLQHLVLQDFMLHDATQEAQLLSQLQELQQLTCLMLNVFSCGMGGGAPCPPAAAYSALTASSKLQHLDVSRCCLPPAVWQHMFPTSRQLPHLQVLYISCVKQPGFVLAAAPEGSCLVRCCPGLQSLDMRDLQYTTAGLAGLRGLSSLLTLHLESATGSTDQFDGVLQLTGLRELGLRDVSNEQQGLFLQLTQLQQLTHLSWNDATCNIDLHTSAPDDEPVWRQVLRRHLDQSNSRMVQHAVIVLGT